jgi:hypothetical protein
MYCTTWILGLLVRTLVGVWGIIFQVRTDIVVKMTVLAWGITPYTIGIFRLFGGRYYLHLIGDWYRWAVKRSICSLPKSSEITILRRCESHPESPLCV